MIDGDEPEEASERQPTDPRVEVLGRLHIACASASPASLMAAHMSVSCAGRLHSVSEDGVSVEIPNPPETTLVGSLAAVIFSLGQGTARFVAPIIDTESSDDGTLRVTLELPETLRLDDRRSMVRVPVPRGVVAAAIVGGPAAGAVEAIDLSLLGTLIEVGADRAASLRIGETVRLRLRLSTVQLQVDAVIQRRDGRRFGLRFLLDDEPPAPMNQLLWRLQQTRAHPR